MRPARITAGGFDSQAVIGMDRFVNPAIAFKEVVDLGQFVAQDKAVLRGEIVDLAVVDAE